jgi:hypothetical protein
MHSDDDVFRRPDWKLPIETEKQIADLLGLLADSQLRQMREGVESLGSRYLRHRKQEIATPTLSAQRKILAELTRLADLLAAQLDQLAKSPDAEFALLLGYHSTGDMLDGDETADPLENDIQHFRRFAQVVKAAHAKFRVRPGSAGRGSLYLLVDGLCHLYQALTGKAATHSPFEKTHDTGEPRSLAGRFVTAAVKAIDPGVTAREVNTAMRYVVRHARKARSQSSEAKGRRTL